MSPPRVVVIGGGITGLSLAFTLQEDARRLGAPLSLTVLEAAPCAGGHAQTIAADGFLVETGPNGFLNREPHTLALVEALGLAPRLVPARPQAARRFILRNGGLCRVPHSPWSFLTSRALSWRGKIRLVMEPFAAAAPEGVDETVYEFARRRIGGEAAEMLVDAAVSGISAGDSRQLSVRAQFPMMTDMEREHGSLISAMLARRSRGAGPPTLLSFDAGLGTLTGTLVERLDGAVHTRSAVRSVDRVASAWRVIVDGRRAIEADEVVLAVPARAAAPMIHGLDPDLASTFAAVRYAGLAVVALGFRLEDVPRPLDGYGYLVTRAEGLATLGVVWESSLFPGRAPAGTALLRVFLGGSRQPGIVHASRERGVEVARQELERVMRIRAAPVHASVFMWPSAIAQYTVGHEARRARIGERLRRHPGLSVCGTSYDGVSFNHAVKSGRMAAARLAERLWGAGSRPATEPECVAVEA